MKFRFFLDPSCTFCGAPPGEVAYLCPSCLESLAFEPRVIHKKQEDFMAGFLYTGRIKDLITGYKFEEKTYLKASLGQLFARLLIEGFPGLVSDGFVVVPSSAGMKKRRGFDPMDLIGEELEKAYGLPYVRGGLKKIKETPLQIQVKEEQRGMNVKGVFEGGPAVYGKNLLLLDDILTTGSTLFEAKKSLLKAGARTVYPLSLAY